MKKQQVTTKTLTLNSIQDEKEIFKLTLATAFAVAAGYGVYANQTKEQTMSDIMLENVEALAQDENSGCYGGGTADSRCPIWNIEYVMSGTGTIMGCSTGGSYKCNSGTCPHGR